MARIPIATRESVPADQRAAFDEIIKVVGSVPVTGPSSILMQIPKARLWQNGLNDYLRLESTLPKKVQELTMLVVAREHDSQYIWNAHAASARKAGLSDALIDRLRDRKELPAMARDETAVVRYGQEYFRSHRVSGGTFQIALEQFGRQGVVELCVLMGMYSLLALLVNTFDCELPEGWDEPLMPV